MPTAAISAETITAGEPELATKVAKTTVATVNDSIRWALEYSPRFRVLEYNENALADELEAAKGGYLPTVDIDLSYGVDNHSSITTRAEDADPSDSDWDARTEAGIVLRQLIWDGGETGSRVDLQSAKLETARFQTKDTVESIALDALTAHMTVVRQQRLVELSKHNIHDHEEILAHLEKRAAAGAGNQADISQTQGRLSRAIAAKLRLDADLISSKARYKKIVGKDAVDLKFAALPMGIPADLEGALSTALSNSPKLLAFGEEITEYQAQFDLAKAENYPKFFAELSKRYKDQVEGSSSWEDTNAALITMDWNLYRGGSDAAKKHAARKRVHQSMEKLQNEMLEVTEAVQSNWATFEASTARIDIYKESNQYNEDTLDAYLKQFSLGERSLLDVLSAENDLFQSEGLLITSQVNELIAAGKILAQSGKLSTSAYLEAELPPLGPRTAKIKTQ